MIKQLFASLWSWLSRPFRAPTPEPKARFRRVVFVEGDELPERLPEFDLVVAREGGALWSAGMQCPCGCGRRLEVMLLEGVRPRWDIEVDDQGRPTLRPSVWVADGCRSHFWLRRGEVEWCQDDRVALGEIP